MLGATNLVVEQELHFRHDNVPGVQFAVPEGYHLHAVTAEHWDALVQGRYGNREWLVEGILGSWERPADFFANSLSYFLTQAGRIVAGIVGTARFQQIVAIDIMSEREHRQRGLGRVLAEAFVNECARRNLTAQWSCMAGNLASKTLAERAGFTRFRQNEIYTLDV